MKYYKFIIKTICCLIVMGMVSYTQAPNVYSRETHQRRDSQARQEFRKKLFKQLDLSPAQKETMQKHRKIQRAQMKAYRDKIKVRKKSLRSELQKIEPDMEKVKQMNAQLKVDLSAMQDHRLQGILGIRKILTPEQFKRFLDLKEKRK